MINWAITDAVNNSPILVFILDEKGDIIKIAGSLAKNLGIDIDNVVNSSAFKVSNFPCRRSHFKYAMLDHWVYLLRT